MTNKFHLPGFSSVAAFARHHNFSLTAVRTHLSRGYCKWPRRGTGNGAATHPMLKRWAQMWTRCTNPKSHKYPCYGGRGITVCPRWKDLIKFTEDMGFPPSATHTLDRINNDGPYSPENCRWATPKEQRANRTRAGAA